MFAVLLFVLYIVSCEAHVLHFLFTRIVCCVAFQLGSIDQLGPAVTKLSDRYHPQWPLVLEATVMAASHAGIHNVVLARAHYCFHVFVCQLSWWFIKVSVHGNA